MFGHDDHQGIFGSTTKRSFGLTRSGRLKSIVFDFRTIPSFPSHGAFRCSSSISRRSRFWRSSFFRFSHRRRSTPWYSVRIPKRCLTRCASTLRATIVLFSMRTDIVSRCNYQEILASPHVFMRRRVPIAYKTAILNRSAEPGPLGIAIMPMKMAIVLSRRVIAARREG